VGRVDAVAAHPPAHHAIEPGPCTHRADQADIAAVLARERRVVEADDVGDGSRHPRGSVRRGCRAEGAPVGSESVESRIERFGSPASAPLSHSRSPNLTASRAGIRPPVLGTSRSPWYPEGRFGVLGMLLNAGDLIDGKYQLVRLIGEGGMGAVYEGVNTRIHRRVAIKVLHAGVAQNAEAVQRFEREAQAAGRIGSEHIVEVLDLGNLPDGDRYMVMEFLEGESLSERIRSRGGMSPGELYPIAVQMLDALAAAHQAGIIHRDLKPDNVFLLNQRGGRADFVKLLDFGISKFSQLNKDSGFSMTRTGAVMGTPYYLAPEQAKGAKDIDRRVDLYAAGVILYEACTGQVPFNADTFNELLFKIVLESPRKPEELVPSLDPAFSAIVLKGMAREAADRYPSAEAFREALEQWASNAGPG